MKISKAMLALVTGFAFAGVAHAEDAPAPATAAAPAAAAPATSAEKKAIVQNYLPGAYAKVEVRHSAFRYETGDSINKDRISLSARPTIGTTLFDGKLDTALTWIFAKANSQGYAKKANFYSDTNLTALDAGNGGVISVESTAYAGNMGHFYDDDLSLNYESPSTWELPAGSSKLGLYVFNMLGTSLTTEKDTSEVTVKRVTEKNGAEFGLTGAASDKVKQRTPTSWDILYTAIYIKPGIVDGLKLSLGTELDTSWTPKYAEEVSGDASTVGQDGYTLQKLTITKIGVSYKINDKLTVFNQVRQYADGFYAARIDTASGGAVPYRWENRLMLTATLF